MQAEVRAVRLVVVPVCSITYMPLSYPVRDSQHRQPVMSIHMTSAQFCFFLLSWTVVRHTRLKRQWAMGKRQCREQYMKCMYEIVW
ncbi:hypothetical protein V8C37DRAFT_388598 [Trichoderma ceciliae]